MKSNVCELAHTLDFFHVNCFADKFLASSLSEEALFWLLFSQFRVLLILEERNPGNPSQ